jgi:hypothetical protein
LVAKHTHIELDVPPLPAPDDDYAEEYHNGDYYDDFNDDYGQFPNADGACDDPEQVISEATDYCIDKPEPTFNSCADDVRDSLSRCTEDPWIAENCFITCAADQEAKQATDDDGDSRGAWFTTPSSLTIKGGGLWVGEVFLNRTDAATYDTDDPKTRHAVAFEEGFQLAMVALLAEGFSYSEAPIVKIKEIKEPRFGSIEDVYAANPNENENDDGDYANDFGDMPPLPAPENGDGDYGGGLDPPDPKPIGDFLDEIGKELEDDFEAFEEGEAEMLDALEDDMPRRRLGAHGISHTGTRRTDEEVEKIDIEAVKTSDLSKASLIGGNMQASGLEELEKEIKEANAKAELAQAEEEARIAEGVAKGIEITFEITVTRRSESYEIADRLQECYDDPELLEQFGRMLRMEIETVENINGVKLWPNFMEVPYC